MESELKIEKLRPLGARALVRPEKAAGVTPGGIVLPDAAQEMPQRGVVLAVGDGDLDDDGTRTAMQVATTDLVLFGQYAGVEVEVNGEKLRLIHQGEILAVIE